MLLSMLFGLLYSILWYDIYDITKYYATSCSYWQLLLMVPIRTWVDLSSSPQHALRMGRGTAPYLLVDPSTLVLLVDRSQLLKYWRVLIRRKISRPHFEIRAIQENVKDSTGRQAQREPAPRARTPAFGIFSNRDDERRSPEEEGRKTPEIFSSASQTLSQNRGAGNKRGQEAERTLEGGDLDARMPQIQTLHTIHPLLPLNPFLPTLLPTSTIPPSSLLPIRGEDVVPTIRPVKRCVFCENTTSEGWPLAQTKFNIKPACDFAKRTCTNFEHSDCNMSSASSFEEPEIGKKYTASKKKRYIIPGWGYNQDTDQNGTRPDHKPEH